VKEKKKIHPVIEILQAFNSWRWGMRVGDARFKAVEEAMAQYALYCPGGQQSG
jgi:hypothetical protein